jgi:restriction system protein
MITTGTFSSGAKKEAEHDPRVDLIDGERLCDLLRDMKLGVNTQIVIDSGFFENF